MKPATPQAELFRLAIESGDCSRAEAALKEYLAWFHSGLRTLQEVEVARNLLEWSVGAATSQKACLTEEWMTLKRVAVGYVTRRRSETWRLDG